MEMQQLMEMLARMEAIMKSNHEEMLKEMRAWREEEEPTSANRKPEAAELSEVPVQDAEVMPVGEPKKKRRRDRHRRNMKNPTRKNCGPQNKLAGSRRVSRSARVAWRKRNIFRKSWTLGDHEPRMKLAAPCWKTSRRATVARRWRIAFKKETPQGTFGCQRKEVTATGTKNTEKDKAWKYPQCNTGIKDKGPKRRLRVSNQLKALGGGKPRYVKEADLRRTARLQDAKRVAGSSVSLRQHKDWTLWRGRPPPKRKKTQGTEEEPVK